MNTKQITSRLKTATQHGIEIESPKKQYWKTKTEKEIGDKVKIDEDMGGGEGTIINIYQQDDSTVALVHMNDGHYAKFNLEYLNSL